MNKNKKISALAAFVTLAGIFTATPAFAVVTELGNLTVNTGSSTLTTRVGYPVTTTVTVATAAAGTNNAVGKKLLLANATKPTGAATQSASVTVATSGTFTFATTGFTSPYVTTTGTTKIAVAVADSGATYTLTPHVAAGTDTALSANPTSAIVAGTVSFTPSVAGTYTYTITPTEADGTTAAGTVKTVTVVASDLGEIACTAYNNASCTQVAGGTASLVFKAGVVENGGTAKVYTVTSTGVGAVSNSAVDSPIPGQGAAGDASNITGTTGTTVTFPSQNFDVLAATSSTSVLGLQDLTLTLYSGVVGTQTVTITEKNASGTPTNTYTKTVTWVAASATGINASKTHMYVKAAGTTCATPGASYEADVVASTNTSRFAAGASVDICVVARDINNNLVSIIGTASTVTSSAGVSDASATDDGGGAALFDLDSPSSLITGTVTFNAVLIDTAGNVITKSLAVPFYGSLTTLTLATVKSAAYAGTDATSPADTFAGITAEAATSDTIVVGITGKDSTGATIDLNAAANSITTSTWTIDSDKTAGAPAIRTGDTVGAVLSSVAPESTELSSTSSYGTNVAYIDCSSKAEKLTITAYGKNSNGDWVASNTIDVYCSAATSTVTVAPSATSVAAGGTLAINVSVKDANGYPVADGTSVTLAANNGAVMAPSSKTTAGGAFTTAANLVAGSESATTTVTAIAGGKTGTALINITGGATRQSAQTMLDNLNAKIVALNALIAKIMKKLGVK
jgi:hypothetical protein